MDAAIKKRVSGEFKSEQRGATVSFSNAEQSSSMKRETKQQQLTSFAEEKCEEVRSVGTPFQQAGFQAAPLQEKNSLFNSNQQEQQLHGEQPAELLQQPAANVLLNLCPEVTAADDQLAIVIQVFLIDAIVKHGAEGLWYTSHQRGGNICSSCHCNRAGGNRDWSRQAEDATRLLHLRP